uniref:Putative major facilitator subfamily transport protein n=1 Tax=uncultured Acidobacteriota bacterium TaxID=171953 RepID=Q7X358_9BACT|nr:putative major facilitator subfamily transport protein [uncultured Acidobacteriota bacterium]
MYLPSLPDISSRLEATTAQTQLTISTYLIVFALGQLFYGPASDRFGRRPVLMTGLVIYCAASFLCAFAWSVELLMLGRALQAVGACSGIVLARAIVRDLYSGARAGRELSLMGMVMALAPVLAPLIGGVLQTFFGWRANFVVLTAAGLVIVLTIWFLLPETLAKRSPALKLAGMLRSFGGFLRDGSFLAHTGLVVFVFAGLFAWISGASFVLQDVYGQSAFDFGVAFAVASGGYMVGTALAAKFVGKYGIDAVSGFGAAAAVSGGLLMVGAVLLDVPSGFALVLPMALYLAGMGGVLGQAIAGALQPYHDRAGAASSLLGFLQQGVSAVVGIIIGHMLGDSAMPMAAGVAMCGAITFMIWLTTRGVRARGLRR